MEVVAAVFTDGERVLACRRHAHLEAGGRWEFPGGKLEPGEALEAALEREIAEELGVEIEVGELLDSTTSVIDGTTITLSCYFVRPVGGPPRFSTDHDELAWCQRDRLMWLNWAEPDLPAIRKLEFAALITDAP
jgi:8-oxo-dGTP diphosphatase